MPNISFGDVAYVQCSPKHRGLALALMRADYSNENKKNTAVEAVLVPLLGGLFHTRNCPETTSFYGLSFVSSCGLALVACVVGREMKTSGNAPLKRKPSDVESQAASDSTG